MSRMIRVAPGSSFTGTATVPGDKSISHRALLFGALATGVTTITGVLESEDTHATAACLRAMGVHIDDGPCLTVHGTGLHGFRPPTQALWMGNSGTTTRLLMGILAGQQFSVMLHGDESLHRRPMDRVAIPLRMMGAKIEGRGDRCLLPITMQGGLLQAISYQSPIASAQVKSAILLAGLYAGGITAVCEPSKSRDHTERMLRGFGACVEEDGLTVCLAGHQELCGQAIVVPGDISSAAFLLIAGAIIPGANITICNVGVNPTRSGVIEVLEAMGADLTLFNHRVMGGEPVADIHVKHRALIGTSIGGSLIPRLIDELPILAVAAAFACGETTIRDASELRVKESDRIATVTAFLRDMGVDIEPCDDGMIVRGGGQYHGATVCSEGDHRIAMSATIAAIAAGVENRIIGAETIATSFPEFISTLVELGAEIDEISTE